MQTIKEFNQKLVSLQRTRKITSSMKMISSVKMQRFTKMKAASQPFWEGVSRLCENIGTVFGNLRNPLVCGYPEVGVSRVLLFTSDRGLCGRFNTNAIKKMLELTELQKRQGQKSIVSCVGSKGYAFVKRRTTFLGSYYLGVAGDPTYESALKIGNELLDSFTSGSCQEVWLVYTRRISSLVEEPVHERLLPITLAALPEEQKTSADYLFEEDPEQLLANMVPLLVRARIHEVLILAALSEHAARMSAMDAATSNADRLMRKYAQLRNRARQASITTELTEIVTGKESLES